MRVVSEREGRIGACRCARLKEKMRAASLLSRPWQKASSIFLRRPSG